MYRNDLDQVLQLAAYTGYTSSQRRAAGLSTEWTTDGSYAKAWRRMPDGTLMLYKAGSDLGAANDGLEPYSEFLCAQVAQAMGLEHVDYGLDVWKGKLASTCELMNSEQVAFVPFYQAARTSSFPNILAAGLDISDDVLESLRDMLVFDAVVCNPDRHAANYGLLRDNRNGELLGFAPLFDHNCALFPREMEPDLPHLIERASTRYSPASGMSFATQASLVMDARHHAMLRRLVDFRFEPHPRTNLPPDRVSALERYIHARARQLLEIEPVSKQALVDSIKAEQRDIDGEPAPYALLRAALDQHDATPAKAIVVDRA